MPKKHIAVNTQLLLCVVLCIVFSGISVSSATENNLAFCIVFAVLALFPLLLFAVLPLYCVFCEEEVIIVYSCGQKERIRWKDIRQISLMGSWIGSGAPPRYMIAYPRKEKRPFFVVGEIPKTRKTKKLLKMYYQKDIV